MNGPAQRSAVVISVASFLISLLSFATASWTFYFTYWYPGELDFAVPEKIGIAYRDGLHVIIPITVTNTGSTRFRSQVYDMAADLSASAPGRQQATFHTRWEHEVTFVSTEDYVEKHQEWIKLHPSDRDLSTQDQIIYVSRALPFQVAGGSFVSKVYWFIQEGDVSDEVETLRGKEANLKLKLQTNSGTRSWIFRLKVPDALGATVTYVHPSLVSADK